MNVNHSYTQILTKHFFETLHIEGFAKLRQPSRLLNAWFLGQMIPILKLLFLQTLPKSVANITIFIISITYVKDYGLQADHQDLIELNHVCYPSIQWLHWFSSIVC
jgi:hypothetical protein